MKEHNKKDLIIINGRIIQKTLLTAWTPIAKECYERGCNCDNCNIIPKESFSSGVCRIKDYVRGYILKGIYPDDNDNKETC